MSLTIAVILGSTRPQRAGEGIAKWFMAQTKNFPEARFEFIDLRDVALPFLDEPVPPLMQQYQNEHTKKWSETVKKYDGYIVVTPEYNHSFPAVLKNAFDYVYHEWAKKPIAFVSYGASSGGSRAVEQLRQVAVELQMAPVREQIMIPMVWSAMDGESVKADRILGDLPRMMQDIIWWAETLKKGRENLS
jgi:NAD(P)H-dependent FMN reductase